MELRIIKTNEAGLRALLAATDDEMKRICTSLESASPTLLIRDLADRTAVEAGLPQPQVRAILEAVTGLYLLMEERDINIDATADAVIAAMRRRENHELTLSEEDEPRFRSRLIRLLSFGLVVGTTAKAVDVMLEHERLYCKARSLTDLRPVFPFRSEGSPVGFVIMHQLAIRYHEAETKERRTFHLSLSYEDLSNLAKVLERARNKENAIKAAMVTSGLHIMESEETNA